MRRPSASTVSRALRCSWWLLPHVQWQHTSSAAAESGSRVHAQVAHMLEPDVAPAAGSDVTDDERAAATHGVTAICALAADAVTAIRTEMAFSWQASTDSAKLLGCHIGRAYPADGGWHGSADAIWLDGDVVHVVDLKTGLSTRVEQADGNEQLATLALAAARATGATRARVHLVFASPTGARTESHDLDGMDLDAHAARLRELETSLAREAQAGTARAVSGDHCTYCPARTQCPETSAATAELAKVDAPRFDLSTPAGIVRARALLRSVRDAADQVDDAIRAMVRDAGGTLSLGNGKALRLQSQARETIQWTDAEREAAKAAGRARTTTVEVLREVKA